MLSPSKQHIDELTRSDSELSKAEHTSTHFIVQSR